MNNIRNVLKSYYDVEITEMHKQQGGWAALAYKVTDGTNGYFLKVYEKQRASTRKLTALIDQYAPVLFWLEENSQLEGKISVPLLTTYGKYKCEDKDNIYLLYDYIDGETIGDQELTCDQIRKLSQMIAELHLYGEEIPVETDSLKEDFEVSFLESLQNTLNMGSSHFPDDLQELINMYKQRLKASIIEVERLSKGLGTSNLKMILCHTDLHNWNLMQSERLMLIDWEGLRLAPAEADMIFFVDKPYFNKFLSIYQKSHPNYSINPDALKFYQEKRRLEDIWEFIEQLVYDNPGDHTRNAAMNYLKGELQSIGK